ncbi:MAG TPA: 4-(cytidine 5'-diphospho)-2-C-methyl-D-erythritol kinase [Acidimicrobiales bacterium]|nr:4-(cytidine 5'-diphospho)-2-C-methyl-D-erythritol kinase [Acidimicrobiales bacterium]
MALGAEGVRALAKLTLSLRVTGVRKDGFHLLEAEMVNVDLADTLYFSEGDGLEVVLGEGARASGFGDVPRDKSNLVMRALERARRRALVRLEKRIPVGAGLGGGSSDAAAVLRWAGLMGAQGARIASELGSDVPFCLAGGGRAVVSGAGEVVRPLPFDDVAGEAYTLAVPPFGVPTGAVYRAWDDLGGPVSDNFNDLEPAALRVEPRLGYWRDLLGEATGRLPRLAGSGSTWFVPGAYPGKGRVVVHCARP